MPRVARATRVRAARRAETAALLCIADADTDEDEELGLLLFLQAREERRRCRSARYGARGPYGDRRRADDFFDVLFDHSSERIFQSWLRMSRAAFWHLHDLIAGDDVFKSEGRRPQMPVKYQLAIFLMRNGGEPTIHAACAISVSEGSAYNFQDRVVAAIRKLRDRFLSWPTGERREDVKDEFARVYFPGCVGIIDGSLIRLRDRPLVNPWAYWCRKKFYALVIQAICDHKRRFIAYEMGWPGSVTDATVLKQSHFWNHLRRYLHADEFLLADKGYPLTSHFIRPFSDHELTVQDARRRKKFNVKLSKVRCEIEHAFGHLKGRFPVLRQLPGHDLERLYMLIEALLVVHNILIDFGDNAEALPHFVEGEFERVEEEEVEEGAAPVQTGRRAHAMGIHRRKMLMAMMHL